MSRFLLRKTEIVSVLNMSTNWKFVPPSVQRSKMLFPTPSMIIRSTEAICRRCWERNRSPDFAVRSQLANAPVSLREWFVARQDLARRTIFICSTETVFVPMMATTRTWNPCALWSIILIALRRICSTPIHRSWDDAMNPNPLVNLTFSGE